MLLFVLKSFTQFSHPLRGENGFAYKCNTASEIQSELKPPPFQLNICWRESTHSQEMKRFKVMHLVWLDLILNEREGMGHRRCH